MATSELPLKRAGYPALQVQCYLITYLKGISRMLEIRPSRSHTSTSYEQRSAQVGDEHTPSCDKRDSSQLRGAAMLSDAI